MLVVACVCLEWSRQRLIKPDTRRPKIDLFECLRSKIDQVRHACVNKINRNQPSYVRNWSRSKLTEPKSIKFGTLFKDCSGAALLASRLVAFDNRSPRLDPFIMKLLVNHTK